MPITPNRFPVQKFSPVGFMDSDSSPWNVATDKGNYLSALNVSSVGLNGNIDGYMTNMLGNTLAFTLPTITKQDKLYVISLNNSTGQTLQVQCLNLNGSQFPINGIATFTPTTGNLVNDTISFANQIAATGLGAHSGFVTPNTSFDGTNPVSGVNGSILVAITDVGFTGFDYQIINGAGATINCTITIGKEALDGSLTGPLIPTGSKDIFGDLFITSSSVGVDPTVYTINNTSNNSGEVMVSVSGNLTSSFPSGAYVDVSGVQGTSEANGLWMIRSSVFSTPNTLITLYNSKYANAYTGGGQITINVNGLINISVHQYSNTLAPGWTSTDLLRTKQINARFNHPERRALSDVVNDIKNLYLTDKNDLPRSFSYTGPYQEFGAIELFNANGFYTYEAVEPLTELQVSNATGIVSSIDILNSAGNVACGLWRYAITFTDAQGNETLPSLLSRPVQICNYDLNNPINVFGSTAGTTSGQAVNITVSDIPIDTYKYVNLIGVNYVGLAEFSYRITKSVIPNGVSSVIIKHSGFETYIDYDDAQLSAVTDTYVTAGDMVIASNTLLMANLTAQEVSDFSSFAQSLTHTIGKNANVLGAKGNDYVGYSLGEYQNPSATFSSVGYMDNETYRFYMVAEFNNGSRTPAFWIDDIRFDNYVTGGIPTNRANPFGNNRRLASFSSYDLSQSSANLTTTNAYVTYVTFSGMNLTTLIAGRPINEIVKRIHIFRVDNSTFGLNEVLGTGLICRHVYGSATDGSGQTVGAGGSIAMDNPFLLQSNIALGLNGGVPSSPNPISSAFFLSPNASYSYGAWKDITGTNFSLPISQSASFYCLEDMFGQIDLEYEAGDSLINYGQPEFRTGGSGADIYETFLSQAALGGAYLKLSGSTGQSTEPHHCVLDSAHISKLSNFAGSVSFNPSGSVTTYQSFLSFLTQNQVDTPSHFILNPNSSGDNFLQVNQNLWAPGQVSGVPTAYSFDIGLYYAQWYRDKGSISASSNASSYPNNTKFGAINTGVCTYTGSYLDISSVATSSLNNASVNVYGGDTFTQSNIFKLQYPIQATIGPSFVAGQYGVAIQYYGQNRYNFDMRNATFGPFNLNFPDGLTVGNYISYINTYLENRNYDQGYTPRNISNQTAPYNPDIPQIVDYGTRKIFSLVKPQGSSGNNYRFFPPLNYKDDDPEDGPIITIEEIEGEIYTKQPSSFLRHFYNERGSLNVNESSSNTSVVLGSGDSFSKPPVQISNNGCSQRFASIIGTGIRGEDVMAWIDTIGKNVMIYSQAGLKCASIEKLMRSWFLNNLNNINGDAPGFGGWINGVFDDKRKSFIWTIVNYPGIILQWIGFPVTYNKGDYVAYGITFEGFNIIWQATQNVPYNNSPFVGSQYWKQVPNLYYTIEYNLLIDGFDTFLTPVPYFYAAYQNTYLTAHPNIATSNAIYMSDTGSYLTWYVNGMTSQTAQGYVQWVVNENNRYDKRFLAVSCNTLISPYRIDFNTFEHASYLLSSNSDFRQAQDTFISPVKNDTITSSGHTPYEKSSFLFGQWMKAKLTFDIGVQQSMWGVETKYTPLARMIDM